MADEQFYRSLPLEPAQGEIFSDVPHIHLRPPADQRATINVVREANTSKPDRRIFGLYSWPPAAGESPALPKSSVQGGAFHLEPPNSENVSAYCQISKAIVLNHECDLVPGRVPKHRFIAMIQPLSTIREDQTVATDSGPRLVRDIIRKNQNQARFFLPAIDGLLEESFVDLRRMSCVDPCFLRDSSKVACLSEVAFKALMAQIIFFLSQRDPVAPPTPTLGALLRHWKSKLLTKKGL
ncbi:hypothetical protein J8F10_24590 [Gemmata sp. G18]|uniref:Uncharacterized protein n=1 Tax=Gemmata palustris TaxID=2822762 RepID=A0ABS5BXK2_9BACT|nr:hypothetical protein [Gemmata palustris]MBP3958439.1 hypothetical protein [Gemmata palustris]